MVVPSLQKRLSGKTSMVSLDVIPFPIVVARLESPGSFEKEPGHIVEGQLVFYDGLVGHADN